MGDSGAEADIAIRQLEAGDVALFESLMSMFGETFEDPETYTAKRPGAAYVERLLQNENFVALAAIHDGTVVGGLAAYELPKFEQERSEMYIYDLAVVATHRRHGVATALINRVRDVGRERGAWVVFVQADRGDTPPIELYSKLGEREDVHHFDIAVDE